MTQAAGCADLQLALERTEQHLRQDGANRHLLARAIDLAVALDRQDLAQQHLTQALALYPDDHFLQFRQAELHALAGAWDAARVVYARLHVQRPDLPIAFGLARCHAHAGEYDRAVELMFSFRDDAALDALQVAALARALHHTGRIDDAVALVNARSTQFERVPDFCASAALVLMDAGDADGAMRLSAAGRAAGGAQPDFEIVDGTLALARVDADAALAHFARVASEPRAQGRARSGTGAAYLLRGDLAAALAELEVASQLLPGHIGTWQLLGWCRLLTQDLSGAEAAFEQAMTLNRSFGDNHGGLATVYALRGQLALARESADKALRLDPGSLSARYAQMVIDGDTVDRERFLKLAQRLLATQRLPDGRALSDLVPHAG